jgi:hypothetical protein
VRKCGPVSDAVEFMILRDGRIDGASPLAWIDHISSGDRSTLRADPVGANRDKVAWLRSIGAANECIVG